MSTPSKAMPLTGSILAIVTGALLVFVAVGLLSFGGRNETVLVVGLCFATVAAAVTVLGALGCMMKPGAILSNAIVLSALDVLFIVGLVMRGRAVDAISTLTVLMAVAATVFLYVGYPRAREIARMRNAFSS